jgi:two-component system, LuxR family, sensor kinase FixL
MTTRLGDSRSDDRPARCIEAHADAAIGASVEGAVARWNKAAEETLGYTSEEIFGQPITVVFISELSDDEQAVVELLRQGRRVEQYETVKLLEDGRKLDVSLTVTPLRNSTGRLIGAVGTTRDITEQKALRARLAQVQSELLHIARLNDMGQLASALAHELSQPLSAISAYVGGARRLVETGDIERALEGYDKAVVQVARAAEVIRRLREFVRKSDGHRSPEDLGQTIEGALELVLSDAQRENLVVDVRVADDARTALIDRVQIEQVLVNLFRNAVEAMSDVEDKRLVVTTRRSGNEIHVEVADSGPGLAGEVLARLFQPFTTTKATGMGVGLSLCRSIIESQGGEISARNAAGGGAVFRFTVLAA